MPENHLSFHSANGKRRILIVEDEIINQEMLRIILDSIYDIVFAATGEEALSAVASDSQRISLILLDLNLPDMHGLEVLKRIKADSTTALIPVIVMTADKDAEVESLTLGAIDFIPKPYPQPKVVLARVLRTIELSEDRDIIRWTERDHLTGLYNREYFYRYASQYDLYHKDQPTDAIVLDINHFHMINERYGKAYGDKVLKQIGEKVLEVVRESGGIVCRREADTFLAYCPHREDYEEILEKAFVILRGDGTHENRVRLRMGVYSDVDKEIDIERRFDRAKLAADTVKNSFTNAVGFYDDSLREAEIYAEQLLEGFEKAIRDKQFKVFYQPKFDIRPEEPVLAGAEALVRWFHPQLGPVSPGVFVPLFEKNGLIQQLDTYVWNEAAARVREWKDRFGSVVPVSLNVSRIDLYDPSFVEKMEKIVETNGLTTSELFLEVTESAYTEDSNQIIETVKSLREKSFHIEMDDFGSGYSSLNMISTLPIDALKLDMQFIRNAFRERKDTRLLEVVIQLAESLGVPTIAEGVETAEQLLTLKAMGCDIVQGYYFSPPLPEEKFETFLRDRREHEIEMKKEGRKQKRDMFTYEALHDPLTGLYNHTAFEVLFHDSDKEHIAVLIADINDYAVIKDGKGRACADAVALRVSEELKKSFRSVDHICRLKEDEFVVIMTRMTSTMKPLIFDKVEQVNEVLQKPDGEVLPVSLSVGVAFSDREKPEGDVFQDADTALLRMKQVRRCGCAVF
ncbi:MAG: EAL domain-containing protein [Stomatobaculum sp.]|nr:EAL domain-containing protein [Stomatobaculum sp.]